MIESHDYQVQVIGSGPKTGKMEAQQDGLPAFEFSSPPEFGGPEGVWSPEHLYVAAISTCLMTTFHAIAEISKVDIVEYTDNASGLLERGEDRLYSMPRVTLRPRIVIDDESKVEKTLRLIEKAEQVCLISRSISSEVVLEPTVLVSYHVGT